MELQIKLVARPRFEPTPADDLPSERGKRPTNDLGVHHSFPLDGCRFGGRR